MTELERIDADGLERVTRVALEDKIVLAFVQYASNESSPVGFHDGHIWAKDWHRTLDRWGAWYTAWFAGRADQRAEDQREEYKREGVASNEY